MALRFAFMGFRHGHIMGLHALAAAHSDIEIVAACEEDGPTREQMSTVAITHDDYARMLDEVPCDVIAIGDYYGKRGAIAIAALERGKHVISDKPLCTSLVEQARIAELAAEKGLAVGCQLDLRDLPAIRGLRDAVRGGAIGEVLAVSVTGQHPLNYGSRPAWYFEPGKHGGTINDIAIHAMDALPWITGQPIKDITAARAWNARLPEVPWFQDGAQFMVTLANGAGVQGDVSYFQPENFGYRVPQYWRFTLWGTDGLLEGGLNTPILLYARGSDAPQELPLPDGTPGGYLQAFLAEINGAGGSPSTRDVLEATRVTLEIKRVADIAMAG